MLLTYGCEISYETRNFTHYCAVHEFIFKLRIEELHIFSILIAFVHQK